MDYSKLTKRKAGRIIGIDCSTNSLAYAIFNDGSLIEYGEIDFNGANTFERLADGQAKLRAMHDRFKADMIIMESAIYVQNKKTVILLAYAFGSILSAIIHKGTVVEELSPTQWQAAIGNGLLTKVEKQKFIDETPDKSSSWYSNKYREFRKGRTAKWVEENYAVTGVSDNVTDAIAIGHVGYKKFAT